MNKVFSRRRHFSCTPRHKLHSLLLTGALLFTLLINPAIGQTEVQNLAVVINALTHPDLGITASLSLIDLAELNENRAVDNEIVRIGTDPINRRRAVGLSIRGHLAYIPSFNLPITGGPKFQRQHLDYQFGTARHCWRNPNSSRRDPAADRFYRREQDVRHLCRGA